MTISMAIFVGILLAKKEEVPSPELLHLVISVLLRMWKTTGNYSSSMQVTIYGISHKKHTQHIAVKSIQSYHSALFSNFLGTFWEHSFSLPHLRIKASWMDYLNRKSLYTYLCNKMSIQLSNFMSVLYLEILDYSTKR